MLALCAGRGIEVRRERLVTEIEACMDLEDLQAVRDLERQQQRQLMKRLGVGA